MGFWLGSLELRINRKVPSKPLSQGWVHLDESDRQSKYDFSSRWRGKPWCEKVRAGSNLWDHPSAREDWSTMTLPGLPSMLHHRIKTMTQVLTTLRPVFSLTEHSEEVVPAVPYALIGSSLSFPFWRTSASEDFWFIPSPLWNLFWQSLGAVTRPFLYVVSAAVVITGISTAVISLCCLFSFISLPLLDWVIWGQESDVIHACLSRAYT